MRSLAGRVKRIERRLGERPCPCGGPWRVRVLMDDDPEPEPCPRCGSAGKLIVLVRAPDADVPLPGEET